jgi:hypothetical protein
MNEDTPLNGDYTVLSPDHALVDPVVRCLRSTADSLRKFADCKIFEMVIDLWLLDFHNDTTLPRH